MNNKYAEYVEHPRYGKGPIYTGLDPNPNDPGVYLHWRTGIRSDSVITLMRRDFGGVPPFSNGFFGAIRGTAVSADLSKQTPATIPVTHYYDEDCVCRDCGRHFLFFALEQKYWYEELRFPLDADCVRCVGCRKKTQEIARHRDKYEKLCHVPDQTAEQMLEMADCCLTLIEEGVFNVRQTEHVRAISNKMPPDHRASQDFDKLLSRLHNIEKSVDTK